MIPEFIIIPEKGSSSKYYIKPFDICNIVQYDDHSQVFYKFGERICSVYTLLTGDDLHNAILDWKKKQDDEFNSMFKFGDDE